MLQVCLKHFRIAYWFKTLNFGFVLGESAVLDATADARVLSYILSSIREYTCIGALPARACVSVLTNESYRATNGIRKCQGI